MMQVEMLSLQDAEIHKFLLKLEWEEVINPPVTTQVFLFGNRSQAFPVGRR